MHTIGSGTDSGVIAAPAAPAAPSSPLAPAAPAPAPDTTLAPAAQQGPITDIPLPQLPPDTEPAQAPQFTTSQKEFEDNGSHGPGAPHLPGAGSGAPDPDAHSSVLGDAMSPLVGAGHDAIHQAAGVLGGVPGAQGVLDGADAALNQAPTALGGAPGAVQQAAAALPANLPALPADPVAALMSGVALPALPGIDMLFKPFLDLLSSFGTGVMGSLNPADLLSQSSQIIQSAMQVGMGAMKSVEQVWQGKSANSAQSAGQQAQAHGEDASQRGFDISKLTDDAAAVVARGNVQLTQVAQSFAAQASALAPVVLTPPGQAVLISTATEYLGQAVTIVNATRGELGGYTGQLSSVVQQLVGANGPDAANAAQAVAQNVGQPIMEQAQTLLSGAGDTSATGLDGLTGSGLGGATSTHASGFGGGNGAHPGSAGGGLGGSLGNLMGGSGSSATPGVGSSVPGARPGAIPGMPFGPGMPGTPGQGTPGSGFMGGGTPAAGQRNSDEERARTVQNYQSPTGNTDLTGQLGETTPDVIGQTHSDEIISEYENDQL